MTDNRFKLSDAQRVELAKALRTKQWAGLRWEDLSRDGAEEYFKMAGAAVEFLVPLVQSHALRKPDSQEWGNATYHDSNIGESIIDKDGTWHLSARAVGQMLANRLRSLSAPPVDPAHEAVSALVAKHFDTWREDVAAKRAETVSAIVAAVRASDAKARGEQP